MWYSLKEYKNNIKRAEGRGRKVEQGRKGTMSTFPLQASNPEVGRAGEHSYNLKEEIPTLNQCRVLPVWDYSGNERHATINNSFRKVDTL